MSGANGRIARQLMACGLVAAALSRPAGAVEEDTVGWWIYAGSIRSTLLSRFIGPEDPTPAGAAIAQAVRGCGLPARFDAGDAFTAPPGDAPVVFGPFLARPALAASLACIRRYVPAAFVTQARSPAR